MAADTTRLLEIGTTVAIELTAGRLASTLGARTPSLTTSNKQQARAGVKQRKLKTMGQLKINLKSIIISLLALVAQLHGFEHINDEYRNIGVTWQLFGAEKYNLAIAAVFDVVYCPKLRY